jgi:hypothetical protein
MHAGNGIGPRVALVMVCGLVVLAMLRIAAWALWQCRACIFLLAWLFGVAGVVVALITGTAEWYVGAWCAE